MPGKRSTLLAMVAGACAAAILVPGGAASARELAPTGVVHVSADSEACDNYKAEVKAIDKERAAARKAYQSSHDPVYLRQLNQLSQEKAKIASSKPADCE